MLAASTIDWNEVGALAAIGATVLTAILIPIAKWVVREVRKAGSDTLAQANQNATTLGAINRRVTTPDSVPGTLGETVAGLALEADAHTSDDDARFGAVWHELGKPEPPLTTRPLEALPPAAEATP